MIAEFLPTPRLDIADPDSMRHILRDYFINTFDGYTHLFDALSCDEAFYVKPITLRHPLIFYFGHTATFFINKMRLARLIDTRINEHMESIFAVGVDEMSWDDLNEAHYDWPSVDEVRQYRAQLRELVLNIIDYSPLTTPINWQHPWWCLIMGIEHERIHLETSSVLIRQHQLSYVRPLTDWPICPLSGQTPINQLITVRGGKLTIGKDRSSPYYGWDNEYGQHQAQIDDFNASRYLVSNQEFYEFMQADGYQTADYWTAEGQGWLKFRQPQQPEFWVKKAETWYLRTMTEEIPMPWNWPVEVNYLEAKAFCQWKAKQTGRPIRLPTEDEWRWLYQQSGLPEHHPHPQPWAANVHLTHWASSCPVDHFAHGEFYDLIGNVWQWSETPIYPFDGFEVHPYYDDFTMPTFDQQHNIICGGSWVSCGNEAEFASRYAFRRHFFQHAGFRYIESQTPVDVQPIHYETDALMSESAEFHYGDDQLGQTNFHHRLIEALRPYFTKAASDKALDLGCAAGRASFELTRYFNHVEGVDFSARFIQLGVQLAQTGVLRYAIADEGELSLFKTRYLADLIVDQTSTPHFIQGDACNLKPNLTGYDFVLMANIIEHLYQPAMCLDHLHERINDGGLLAITTNADWQADITPIEHWIGGIKKDGESYSTQQAIADSLNPHFNLIAELTPMQLVIRKTSRQWQVQEVLISLWQKKPE